MTNDKLLTKEEILKQLPDEVVTSGLSRQFTSAPIGGYTSVWETPPESTFIKVWKKFMENPFVPIGLCATVYFLGRGVLNMGNRDLSQKMMRGRVLAQGFTVIALVAGVSLEAYKRAHRNQKN